MRRPVLENNHLNEGQRNIPLSIMGCLTLMLALLQLNGRSLEALA